MRSLTLTNPWKLVFALLLGALALAAPMPVLAAACTWDGSTGNWSNSTHWSCGAVPGASDTATISGGTVNITSDVTIQNLILSGGILQGSNNLTVTQGMTWTNGKLSGNGATTIANGAALNITAIGDCVYSGPRLTGRTLNIAGTATLTGTTALCVDTGATINNSGLFDVVSNVNVNVWAYGTANAVLSNTGTLRKSGGAGVSAWTSVAVNNASIVQAQSGTLSLANGGTSSGSYSATPGATLDFGGGTHAITLTAASSISGGGTVRFSADTTTISGSGHYAVAGTTLINGGTLNVNLDATTVNLTVSSGALQGSNGITVTQAMTWTNGKLSGNGATTIANGATLNITAIGDCYYSGPRLTGRALNVAGTATLTGTTALCVDTGATINNSGLFDVVSNVNVNPWAYGTPNAVFSNTGTLRKSGGVGTSAWTSVAVNNASIVQAQSGTLSFDAGFTQNGGVTALDGGSLSRPGNTLNFYGGVLTGTGFITGNVSNVGGTVAPGNSPGVLRIVGNYTQGPTGTLNIELGGVVSGTQYDLLDVTGAASLSGTLDVSLINSFTPISGTVFRIMNFGTRSGDFITNTGSDLGNGMFVKPYYSADHLSLIAGTPVADLSLSLTDGQDYAISGDPIAYTLVVHNAGPDAVNGAVVTDTLPGSVTGITWTCAAAVGSSCPVSGSGLISTTVNLGANSGVTFTISGRIAPGTRGLLLHTAGIAHFADPDRTYNFVTDSDGLLYLKIYLPMVIRQ